MSETDPQTTDPQTAYIQELQAEAALLPEHERADHEALIAELTGELALSQAMQDEADDYIRRAKELAHGGKEQKRDSVDVPIDYSRIGWLGKDSIEVTSATQVKTSELEYLFVDLSIEDRVTKQLRENLDHQGETPKLMHKLVNEGIPNVWRSIVEGKKQDASISVGNKSLKDVKADRSLNTSYPAYKLDVKGTNNRAIVLLLDKVDGKPLVALAALYDHDDQKVVYNHMFLKKPNQAHNS